MINVCDGEKGPLVLKLTMCRALSHTELGRKKQQEERLVVVERLEGKGVKEDTIDDCKLVVLCYLNKTIRNVIMTRVKTLFP